MPNITRCLLLTIALAGCCKCSSEPADASLAAVESKTEALPIATATDIASARPRAITGPGYDPASGFVLPSDRAGGVLPLALALPDPEPLSTERFGQAPLTRTAPVSIRIPEPAQRSSYPVPPVPSARPKGIRFPTPAEHLPVRLGTEADTVPARPMLPDVAPANRPARSRDVNIPPSLPQLGRQQSDRASVDDPTAEPTNSIIVNGVVIISWVSAAFFKVDLPNPFELAEQIKVKLSPAVEPGMVPVVVTPERVK